MYPFPIKLPKVAASDGAGEVVEVGSRVTQWKKGDKVVTLFNQGHQYGELRPETIATALGGCLEGTLRPYGAFHEMGLVRAPSNLNHVEASTLSCAAVTSWNALYGLKQLKPGQWVVTQGTGGVGLFALQVSNPPPPISSRHTASHRS
jgi:NADPH:quinone reductase-like Zn-dependent oxidoreductase